ncbi:MAG: molecular chaperone HtpG [Deltaproteobacteria bacterium]|jgi:molecular chaperone HtpG|nr:molecular chaperone HtpG [Deltaproteobacteria bacterium]
MSENKTRKFKAETRKVLNILTHSLYTQREIFLRELLSNAADALEKLRFLQSGGRSVRDEDLPLEIRIKADKERGILQISDTGLGMTEEELIADLGTIAHSGSELFAGEMAAAGTKDSSGAQLIGRFGIGFYSVFMVAESVELVSVPALGEEGPRLWTSAGEDGFGIRALEGEEAAPFRRGTVIRAKLKEDAREFLEKERLLAAIRKHSNFLPFPVFLEDEKINTIPALWREPKFSISAERYREFYDYLTSAGEAPLEVIHLAADAPVQFNALIFIPDSAQDFLELQEERRGLDLYVRRVLIARSHSALIPNYLAFLRGVADTEDLPLNISRESLQENLVLRKISQTIVRHILNHLEKMAREEPDKYARFWKLHGKYFKFAFNDYLNREKVAPLMRFASSAGPRPGQGEDPAFVSLDDYLSRAKPGQNEIWHLAAPSPEAAGVNPHLERFRRKGIEVLYLLEPVDEFALESLGKYREHPFKSVEQADARALEAFPDLEEASPPPAEALRAEEKASLDKLISLMRSILGERVGDIRLSDRLAGSPAVLVSPDGVSSSMEKLLRVMRKSEGLPPKVLEVNQDHPLLRNLLRVYGNNPEDPLIPELTHNLYDHVLLLDGCLDEASLMADRGLKLLDRALSWYAELLKRQ